MPTNPDAVVRINAGEPLPPRPTSPDATPADHLRWASNVLTPQRVQLLVMHVHYVQGGATTAEEERQGAMLDLLSSETATIDFARIKAEVDEAVTAQIAALADSGGSAAEQVATTGTAAALATGTPEPDAPAELASDLPMAKIRRYRELYDAHKGAEAEAKAVKDELLALEAELVEAYVDAETQSVNVDGKTIYLHRSVFAQRKEGADADDVKAALLADGLSELVTETVNSNTLSAYVREATEGDDSPGLPENLAAVIEPGERFGIRVKASAAPRRTKK